MLITYTNYLYVGCVCVCVCPGEGIVAFNTMPNPFHLNKICLNQQVFSGNLSLPLCTEWKQGKLLLGAY